MSVRNLLTDNVKTWAKIKAQDIELAEGATGVKKISTDLTIDDDDTSIPTTAAVNAIVGTEDLFDADGNFVVPKVGRGIKVETLGDVTGLLVEQNASGNARVECVGAGSSKVELLVDSSNRATMECVGIPGGISEARMFSTVGGTSQIILGKNTSADSVGLSFRTGGASSGWFFGEPASGKLEFIDQPAANTIFEITQGQDLIDFDTTTVKSTRFDLPTTNNYLDELSGNVRLNSTSGDIQITTAGEIRLDSASNDIRLRSNGSTRLNTNSGGVFSLYSATNVVAGAALHIDGGTGEIGVLASTKISKMNVEPLKDVDFLYKLKPIKFDYKEIVKDEKGQKIGYKEKPKQGSREYGFYAEDMADLNPDFCIFDKNKTLIGIKYDRLITPIIKSLIDQKKEIAFLKSEIERLKR